MVQVCLFHCTLLMKAAFTDSLFSAEDEAFLLKRLVALCQHPQMSTAAQLFYTDCLVHFPENRPIGAADGGEALPVLLTPRLAASLVPTVFDEPATMLARLNVSALVHLEEHGAREGGAAGGGLAYLWDHLLLRLHVVEHGGDRAAVVTFFRASFLFLCHFGHVERHAADLRRRLDDLTAQTEGLRRSLAEKESQVRGSHLGITPLKHGQSPQSASPSLIDFSFFFY
jgi:hypothetical protein